MSLQRIALRTVRRARPSLPSASRLPSIASHHLSTTTAQHSSEAAPATIADVSFWKSLVPKPLRKENRKSSKGWLSREWNPATFFIVMFLFIGSMSIQMIALRNQTDRYMRQASVRLGQLREVVERIQNGEDVDVDKLLGTGDEQKEEDWEEVLRAIERGENEDKAAAAAKKEGAKSRQPEPEPALKPQPTESRAAETEKPKGKPANFGSFF